MSKSIHKAQLSKKCANEIGERYREIECNGGKVSQRWRGSGDNWSFPVNVHTYLIYWWVAYKYVLHLAYIYVPETLSTFFKPEDIYCSLSSTGCTRDSCCWLYLHSFAYLLHTATGQRSFAVNGPTVWNSLPPALGLRSPDLSQNTFKRALKTHLFSSVQRHWVTW